MAVQYRDISIDLETLGKRWDAPIIAIGAAAFDRKTGKIGATFYQEVDFESACRNCRVDGSTVAWWMQQSADARAIFADSRAKDKLSLATSLQMFGDWARGITGGTPIVWGNGATFDITIMEHSYDVGTVGLQEPWHFTAPRDMRTIWDIVEDVLGVRPDASVKFQGVKHNAKDDAVHQARVICEGYKMLRLATEGKSQTIDEDEEL